MWYLQPYIYPYYYINSFLTKDECLTIINEYTDKEVNFLMNKFLFPSREMANN